MSIYTNCYHSDYQIYNDKCGICFDPLENEENGEPVAHEGEGIKHAMHRKCLQVWFRKYPLYDKCPSCKIQVDKNSLFTWKDRTINELKSLRKAASIAMINLGAVYAMAWVISTSIFEVPEIIDSYFPGAGKAATIVGVGIGVGQAILISEKVGLPESLKALGGMIAFGVVNRGIRYATSGQLPGESARDIGLTIIAAIVSQRIFKHNQ
jgi:hypothetical protein